MSHCCNFVIACLDFQLLGLDLRICPIKVIVFNYIKTNVEVVPTLGKTSKRKPLTILGHRSPSEGCLKKLLKFATFLYISTCAFLK